ncbi:hypothetical protein OG302_02225 [Streptomyces sp. NBC_01283]|uniref:hypothetical protein n=1 Tax=Streptomyces sp. NBC_01283 TaxID=2903812 RepID=UPI00352E4E68|nr:hypothetical protein OG302_02225 [Streptomyces sp. NBC_01283]
MARRASSATRRAAAAGPPVGAFLNGVLITLLPAFLLGVLGSFGSANTTFGDAGFGWFGLIIGNAAKAGSVAGIVLMLLIGVAVLVAAIAWQKKVVDTGWDPGAARDKLLPAQARETFEAQETSAPTTTREYAKFAPPAGAPKPPRPEDL